MTALSRAASRPCIAVAAVGALLAASACGTSDGTGAAASLTPSPTVTGQVDPADTEGSTSWESVLAFNEALAAKDYDAAAALASPGSPAEAYVTYREQVDRAQQDAGAEPVPDGTVTADQMAGSVTVTIQAEDETVEYTWSDFQTDETGLVAGWTTDQGPLSTLISTPESQGEAAGGTVTLQSAYLTNEGAVLVVLSVAASDDALSVDDAVVLRGADGSSAESTATIGPAEIASGQQAYVVYQFENRSIDGVLVYEVQNSYDAPAAVELDLT